MKRSRSIYLRTFLDPRLKMSTSSFLFMITGGCRRSPGFGLGLFDRAGPGLELKGWEESARRGRGLRWLMRDEMRSEGLVGELEDEVYDWA